MEKTKKRSFPGVWMISADVLIWTWVPTIKINVAFQDKEENCWKATTDTNSEMKVYYRQRWEQYDTRPAEGEKEVTGRRARTWRHPCHFGASTQS